MIKVTFPDHSVKEFAEGTTSLQIAESISPRLAKEVLAAKVNGTVWDLTRPLTEDADIQLLKWDDEDGKRTYWHSSAHLMAEALQQLYPDVKFGIGPAIENGFYYDVDLGDRTITDEDFARIETRMLELAARAEPIVRHSITKADAMKMFGDRGEVYKTELISELEDGKISTYTQGTFTDLCRGPHLPDTSYIKAVKITSVAGAYWRGDEKRKQLVRLYGITFPKKKMLDDYLAMLEEAKKRDHRKVGRELELFTFSPAVGAGDVGDDLAHAEEGVGFDAFGEADKGGVCGDVGCPGGEVVSEGLAGYCEDDDGGATQGVGGVGGGGEGGG